MERGVGTGIGIDDDHVALRDTVRRWVGAHDLRRDARATLDADDERLPAWWEEVAALGWLGLHVPEADGGSGYGLLELAVVLEELGRECAPGPLLPTAVVAAAVDRFAAGPARAVLHALASGERRAGVGVGCAPVPATARG